MALLSTSGTGGLINTNRVEGVSRVDQTRPSSLFDLAPKTTPTTTRRSSTIRATKSSLSPSQLPGVGERPVPVPTSSNLTTGLGDLVSNLKSLLKPVSTFLGGTLATLTGLMQDPLGSISVLPRQIAALVEQVNPKFAAKLEGTFKKYKMDALANLPGQIIGSIRSLLTFADAVLTMPIIILQDIYNGLMEVMDFINEVINGFLNSIFNFIFGPGGLLDDILPIGQILAFIQEVSALAGEIGGLAGAFLGANPISAFTLQVQGYANQVGGFMQNPLDALFAYAPPQVSQALYVIRNPQQMINSILPPELSQLFAGVSKATGFGFNGNMGYGFASVLNGLRGGVLSSILTNFSAQYPILTPLLGLLNGGGGMGGAPGNNATSLFTSIVNPNLKTSAGGFTQPQQLPEPVIPSTQQLAFGLASSNAATNLVGRTVRTTTNASGQTTNFSINPTQQQPFKFQPSSQFGGGGGMLRTQP